MDFIKPYFTKENMQLLEACTLSISPFQKVTAEIIDSKGEVVFRKENVEFPSSWSTTAVNIVTSKYFAAEEYTLIQLIDRVANTITESGVEQGYFLDIIVDGKNKAAIFNNELKYILYNQLAAFNSPVWFNVGLQEQPQSSACFINSVEDSIDSIMDLARKEARIFKDGSGTGTNLSPLRSKKEKVKGGGFASGPVSFMKGFDTFSSIVKSGGKLRRAAKMVILDADHPDIMEFIQCKVQEEQKARALIAAGYDGSLGGEAFSSVFFQNSNNSVRVTDEFMEMHYKDENNWPLKARTTGEILKVVKPSDIIKAIAESVHACGDPGIQFHDTINSWNTVKISAIINSSNPCSEFMFIDDSACNLASINLLPFIVNSATRKIHRVTHVTGPYSPIFDIDAFTHTVEILILAQDILINKSSYPTDKIRENSIEFRPLGLGYTGLGQFLMAQSIPYQSEFGREYAAAITSLMTSTAYKTSQDIANAIEEFSQYSVNKECMDLVIKRHRDANPKLEFKYEGNNTRVNNVLNIWRRAINTWNKLEGPYRNAQVTLLAPCGTISFMMDSNTTSLEPETGLVKYKKLIGGGTLKLINPSIRLALTTLGKQNNEIDKIIQHIETNGTIEGSPLLTDEELRVFDCAYKAPGGERVIDIDGHLKMMAAVQPFLSGAISKTVSLPHDVTVDDISGCIVKAWRWGLKSIAMYRDGSKAVEPLTNKKDSKIECVEIKEVIKPIRRRLPDERPSMTHKFNISGYEGYLTVGLYEDGTPGELFVRMAKTGSMVNGLMDSFALSTSLSLQYGVPLNVLIDKYTHTRFEPSGFTSNREIPIAKSIVDYIFRWLDLKFNSTQHEVSEITKIIETVNEIVPNDEYSDAPACHECGSWMTRSGTCYRCPNCGATSGCS